ncbi:putative polysaccharide biosynthesis protein [unidentified eubacterium SCB49]|nr:putative polysaccharide biosynthesis protein [unidentified eubacterium SCB49]
MKEKIFKIAPLWIQNILISVFNLLAYNKRYGGKYKSYLKEYEDYKNFSLEQLKEVQAKKLALFSAYVLKNSEFYKNHYSPSVTHISLKNLEALPIVTKEHLQKYTETMRTIPAAKGVKSQTGGTTGKPVEVVFTKNNMQERFAILDTFRGQYGYALGKRTAWFSSKKIVFDKDVKKKRFWKTDYLHNIRYYSSFHLKADYLYYYIENLIEFKPAYLSGFPSTMLEIAQYGLQHNISFPENTIVAIFPTAETITPEMREIFESFFKAKVYDQYASSEGAPFIYECVQQKLHIQLQTGVFEVLDDDLQPASQGKLVVTSFTTQGTPLIRYDIGDQIALSDEVCCCGDHNPVVDKILGRYYDFIYTPTKRKVSLGNLTAMVYKTKGIVKFQVVQNQLEKLDISVVIDKAVFTKNDEQVFLQNWQKLLEDKMTINLKYVTDIPTEASGKFALIKNNIKDA